MFKVLTKGAKSAWGFVSKYITPALLASTLTLSYLLYDKVEQVGELKSRALDFERLIEDSERESDLLRGEVDSLKQLINQSKRERDELKGATSTLESRWELLEEKRRSEKGIIPVKNIQVQEGNINEKHETRSVGDSVDLSDEFRLLNEAYCLTDPTC